jgi:hypothetical protein
MVLRGFSKAFSELYWNNKIIIIELQIYLKYQLNYNGFGD